MRVNKKISVGAAVALIIMTIALTVSVTMVVAMRIFNSTVNDVSKRQAMYGYITDIDKAARSYYAGTIDEEKLRAALAEGYVKGLGDPYAVYLPAAAYQQEKDRLKGNYTGLGLEIAQTTAGEPVVVTVYKNSPAEKAGVLKGDIVTALDGTAVAAADYAKVKDTLAGADKVLVTFRRGKESKAFDLSRSTFSMVSVDSRMIGDTGYIHIRAFNENTFDQFKSAYAAMEKNGATGYIFDLRNNVGGSLEVAEEIVAYLMPRGTYAKLTQRQADGSDKVTELKATDSYQMEKPSATLINAATAGEAELFAGVLQEFGKTTVVGTASAGRGLIQQYFSISADGSAVKISVSALSLIKGGALEGMGVSPNKEIALAAGLETRIELLTDAEDIQLQGAIAVLQGSASTPTTPQTTEAPAATTQGQGTAAQTTAAATATAAAKK